MAPPLPLGVNFGFVYLHNARAALVGLRRPDSLSMGVKHSPKGQAGQRAAIEPPVEHRGDREATANNGGATASDAPVPVATPADGDVGNTRTDGGRAMKNCTRCGTAFLPLTSGQRVCKRPDCKKSQEASLTDGGQTRRRSESVSSLGSQTRQSKRLAEEMTKSPDANGGDKDKEDKKKKKSDDGSNISAGLKGAQTEAAPDLDGLLVDIEELDRDGLVARAFKLAEAGRAYAKLAEDAEKSLALLSKEFNAYKIAFADQEFKKRTKSAPGLAGSSGYGHPDDQATIVATIDESKSTEEITTGLLDKILDAGSGGPVPQVVKRRGDRVYLSFADALQSGKARGILESSGRDAGLFKSVESKKRLFPAVVRNVELGNVPWLLEEVRLRNELLRGSLEEIKPFFRSKRDTTGHAKLLFSSRRKRDEAISRGKIYVDGRRFAVEEVNWDREVRRCYRCQRYGHIAGFCKAGPSCGHCAGDHESFNCDTGGPKKCTNCGGGHQAGDPACREQVRMVRRLRDLLDE